MRLKSTILSFVMSVLFGSALVFGKEPVPPVYVLSVIPYAIPTVAYKDWAPLVQYLSEKIGIYIKLRVYQSFQEFRVDLVQAAPDFVLLNPYQQRAVHHRHGYIPLVRSSIPLQGIIVVRRDSPFQKLQELDGRKIVFPHSDAFAASIYMRARLTQQEHIRFIDRHMESHNDVYRSVIIGDADAGSGTVFTLSQEKPQVVEQLRIIYKTPPTVSHPLSAHPRVPSAVRVAITQAILDLAQTSDGEELLTHVRLGRPQRADLRDYTQVDQFSVGDDW